MSCGFEQFHAGACFRTCSLQQIGRKCGCPSGGGSVARRDGRCRSGNAREIWAAAAFDKRGKGDGRGRDWADSGRGSSLLGWRIVLQGLMVRLAVQGNWNGRRSRGGGCRNGSDCGWVPSSEEVIVTGGGLPRSPKARDPSAALRAGSGAPNAIPGPSRRRRGFECGRYRRQRRRRSLCL